MSDLHLRLVSRQTTQELCRKQRKAARRGYWTQEDIDTSKRLARELRGRVLPKQGAAIEEMARAMEHTVKQKRRATRG